MSAVLMIDDLPIGEVNYDAKQVQIQELDATDYCMNCPGDSCSACLYRQSEEDGDENVVDFFQRLNRR